MSTQPNNSHGVDIEFRGVTKRFADVLAVDDVSIAIEQGAFFSFLGPSGCGKTTSLRLIAGFEQPTAGDIMIGGRSVVGVPPFKRPVNMVFQQYALFPHFNVADNIGYGLRQQKPRPEKQEIARRVGETLALVRLDGFERRRIWELSGGQQQRVALARALINRPTVLLLDEPLAALDRKLRQEMQIELQTLQRDVGITFVLVTHDQEEALSMSDTICIMDEGRILQIGDPRELYDEPVNHFVADFVGKSNFFWGTVEEVNGAVAALTIDSGLKLSGRLPKGARTLSRGDSVAVAVRPEAVLIGRPGADSLAETDVRARARVKNRIFLGEQTEYLVTAESLGDVLVLSSKHNETVTGGLATGDAVEIGWRNASTLALEKT